jgi:glucose-1-phosphate thymidylyltransferase
VDAGADRLTLVVGHLGDAIVDWVKSEYRGISVDFARQVTFDGLAGAVSLAAPSVDDSPTMVVLGDTVFEADLAGCCRSDTNTLAVCRVEDPRRFGVVVERDGKALRLVEKPVEFVSDLAIVGIYGFRSGESLVRWCGELRRRDIRTRGEYQLTDVMQLMIDAGEEFELFRVSEWLDCGRPETLLETNGRLLSGREAPQAPPGCLVVPPVHIDPTARLERCIIGPNTSIGPGCEFRDCILRNTLAFGWNRGSDLVLESSILGYRAAATSSASTLLLGDDCTQAV